MADATKIEKLKEAIRAAASKFIIRESNHQSLITITDIVVSSNGRVATILISVMPSHKEDAALDFLKRQRSELRNYLKDEIRTGMIGTIDFALDLGEKNRQRIDEISKNG